MSSEKQIPEHAAMTYKMAIPMKTEAAGSVFDINEKALVRRIDYGIVPLMFFCYLMQFLDKVLINVYLSSLKVTEYQACCPEF